MTRLSLSLLLIAAIAGCFAACSSSSNDSGAPSAGSAGQAGDSGASAGGEGGASDGGSSDHSTGGANVATAGDSGLAGDGAGASAATGGTDESGGAAGEASGSSGSAGNPAGGLSAGGSAGSAAGGSGGSAGSQVGGGGGTAGGGGSGGCGPTAHAAFANGLAAYFLANVAKHDCLAKQTEGSGAAAVDECAGNGCNGSVGCASNFVWHDAAYDASTGHFSVQVDITSSVTLTVSASLGGATCTLDEQESDDPIAATVSALDTGTSLKTELSVLTFHQGSDSTSGCALVASLATLSSSLADALLVQAAEDAVTTLNAYQVACTP